MGLATVLTWACACALALPSVHGFARTPRALAMGGRARVRGAGAAGAVDADAAEPSGDADADVDADPDENSSGEEVMGISSPLRWLGPYPALALSFPELATPSQRENGKKGITLDFILDTGSNVNTINAQVALELCLDTVGAAPAGHAVCVCVSLSRLCGSVRLLPTQPYPLLCTTCLCIYLFACLSVCVRVVGQTLTYLPCAHL